MKVALMLHGLVGSMKGKHFQKQGGTNDVLKHSYEFNKKNIIDQYDTDVFIHCWNDDLKQSIEDLYNPAISIIEPQKDFEIPSWINAEKNRAFAHLSRWYSFKMAAAYCEMQYRLMGSRYDVYLIQRFDLIWNVIPEFPTINGIYVGKSTLNPAVEWSDRWFAFSSLDDLRKFATLYDNLEHYMKNKDMLPSSKQYGGISSHYLTKFHAKQYGLEPHFKYTFGGYGQSPNDYNEVRRQISGDDS
jgi:hypothetical protein